MTTREMAPELVATLRRAIQASKQSLNQLGATCGLDGGRLSRFVRGERDLTLTAAGRLCEVLGLSLLRNDSKATESALPKPRGKQRAKK